METTVTVRTAPLVVPWHNRRTEYSKYEKHIDPNGVHEIWRDAELQDVYSELFSQSVDEYNSKQKRADRKIENYYADVCADTRGKPNKELQELVEKYKKEGRSVDGIKVKGKHPAYEMIISVGNSEFDRDEDGKIIYSEGEDAQPLQSKMIDPEIGKQILMDYASSWADRNPNLELYGVYYHADEGGVPHLHCDFVPWADGFSQGMTKQSSINKALEAQGFAVTPEMEREREEHAKANPNAYRPQMNPYTLWQDAERKALEDICAQYGFDEIKHPTREKKERVKHIDSAEYRELQGLRDEISAANMDLSETIATNEYLKRQNKTLSDEITEKRRELGDLDKIQQMYDTATDIQLMANRITNGMATKKYRDNSMREFMENMKRKDGTTMYSAYIESQTATAELKLTDVVTEYQTKNTPPARPSAARSQVAAPKKTLTPKDEKENYQP